MMRSIALACVLLAVPTRALADGYRWGGAVGGVQVAVWLPGFRDGAGGSGTTWSEPDARRFAQRAAQLAAMVRRPLRLVQDERSTELEMILDGRRIATGIAEFEGSELQWDALVALLARRGFTRRAATHRELYTLELSGAPVADALEEPPGQAYFAVCTPCSTGGPAVIHTSAGGRRVVGVFATPGAAARALRAVERTGRRGRVARL